MTSTSDLSPPALQPLHLLDHYLLSREEATASRDEILRVADFLFGTTLDGALTILDSPAAITQVISPSRSIHLVRASSTNSQNHRTAPNQLQQRAPSSYICILPNQNDFLPMTYCSCHSYFERNKNKPGICKHLLAIKLMPHLQVKPCILKTCTEEEFSNLVTSRTSLA